MSFELDNVIQAVRVLKDRINRTPLIYSSTLSNMFKAEVFLKLENLQKTGSFKVRGAAYKIWHCLKNEKNKGVVAASAGNHAQGVAFAAREAEIKATILMPEWASISKQEATIGYGGQLIVKGRGIEDCLQAAKEFEQKGDILIHPFDDPDIIHGQGTIAFELFEDVKDPDLIVVPIGGGGLISGIAATAKALKSDIRVIGVQTEVYPSALESLTQRKVTAVPGGTSIADGISVKKPGIRNLKLIKEYVDEITLVDEGTIAKAVLMLLERKKILVEGAGAVSLAALMSNSIKVKKNSKVVLIVSGGNMDSPLLGRVISKGLVNSDRIMKLQIDMDDTPGSLSRLLALIAKGNANVLQVFHERHAKELPIYTTRVELQIETRSTGHKDKILKLLQHAGYTTTMRED